MWIGGAGFKRPLARRILMCLVVGGAVFITVGPMGANLIEVRGRVLKRR